MPTTPTSIYATKLQQLQNRDKDLSKQIDDAAKKGENTDNLNVQRSYVADQISALQGYSSDAERKAALNRVLQDRIAEGQYYKPLQSPRKDSDFKNMARLATIPAQGYSSGKAGKVVIYLPHLPEELELPRENTYEQQNTLVTPDGLWMYQSTNPLEINFSFTLHAFDPLCVEGPKTLLDIAARLHTLTLPASNDQMRDRTKAPPAINGATSAPSIEQQQQNQVPGQTQQVLQQADQTFKYPPACSLRLIQAGPRGLGINCVGFVKAATPTFKGPWLQTASSDAYNLPSACTYKFTFVHNPFYTGNLRYGKLVNAFGPDVFQYFYNTSALAAMSQNTYSDVEKLSNTQSGVRITR